MSGSSSPDSIGGLFTAYRYGVGVVVPLVVLLVGLLGRKVARGPGWAAWDFYLGPELTLTGVSGALVNVLELLFKPGHATFGVLEKKLTGGNIGLCLLGLLTYYFILSMYQDFGPASSKSKKKQLLMMLGICNVVGLATLFGALLLMAP